jgi:heme/copper-type cytochrome/quinol oxidase subunit 2
MNQLEGKDQVGSNAYLAAAFAIAFSVLLIIPMWAYYGVLLPSEGGHGHAHGGEEAMSAEKFEELSRRFIEEHRLPDGSVRVRHGSSVYVLASQYTFTPNTIRLTAGEEYELRMLSADVVHAFSIQMGGTSYNAVVMPKAVTALKLEPKTTGTYLIVCSEYCGIGHDTMYFSVSVELAGALPEEIKAEPAPKPSPKTKGNAHGDHRHDK